MNYKITPEELLSEVSAPFVKRKRWLSLKICPFCGGGRSGEKYSFSVHVADGNYFCHRTKCGSRGSFWKLLEMFGRNPREYLGENTGDFCSRPKKKKFMYGRNNG